MLALGLEVETTSLGYEALSAHAVRGAEKIHTLQR